MKSVSIRIRSTTSRVPFRGGTYSATLEEEGGDYLTLGTTRGHGTWAAAAAAALRIADALESGNVEVLLICIAFRFYP